MAGKREYSYLPLNSFNYISYDAFQKLVYCVGDDKIKHSENVNNLVKQILNKANVYLNTIK
jgi:hypothetical protein